MGSMVWRLLLSLLVLVGLSVVAPLQLHWGYPLRGPWRLVHWLEGPETHPRPLVAAIAVYRLITNWPGLH